MRLYYHTDSPLDRIKRDPCWDTDKQSENSGPNEFLRCANQKFAWSKSKNVFTHIPTKITLNSVE